MMKLRIILIVFQIIRWVMHTIKKTENVLEILEENNYYPFGLKHEGYNTDNISRIISISTMEKSCKMRLLEASH